MRFKQVLFIAPYYREDFYQAAAIPVGLGYLASALKAAGIEYAVMDMGIDLGRKYGLADLQNKIKSFAPDLIAISQMSYRYKDHYRLAEQIKQPGAQFKIVVGGPHVSSLGAKVLEDCLAIDFGIALEGEEALVELCQGKPEKDILGLFYRDNGKVMFTGQRQLIADLDKIPFPRYESFELDAYSKDIIPIFSSRGCPFSCVYCAAGKVIGKNIRTRSIPSLIEEVEYWQKMGYREIGIGDDNFTFYKERAVLFCEEVLKRGLNKKVRFSVGNGIRADKADRKLLELMKRANFYCVALGVEAGNNRILENIKKGERIEIIEEALKNCAELGFEIKLYFLVGSPGEGAKDIEDSIKLALKYPVMTARFYNLIPYPGTELFEWVGKNNYFIHQPEKYLNDFSIFDREPVFQTPQMPYEKRREYLRKTDCIRRKIESRYWQRQWKAFGALAGIFAWFYTLHIVQRSWVRQGWFNPLKKIAKKILTPNKKGR